MIALIINLLLLALALYQSHKNDRNNSVKHSIRYRDNLGRFISEQSTNKKPSFMTYSDYRRMHGLAP